MAAVRWNSPPSAGPHQEPFSLKLTCSEVDRKDQKAARFACVMNTPMEDAELINTAPDLFFLLFLPSWNGRLILIIDEELGEINRAIPITCT